MWGWLILLALACAILLGFGSAMYGVRAHRITRTAQVVLDSLGAIQCVPVRGDEVILRGRLR